MNAAIIKLNKLNRLNIQWIEALHATDSNIKSTTTLVPVSTSTATLEAAKVSSATVAAGAMASTSIVPGHLCFSVIIWHLHFFC